MLWSGSFCVPKILFRTFGEIQVEFGRSVVGLGKNVMEVFIVGQGIDIESLLVERTVFRLAADLIPYS